MIFRNNSKEIRRQMIEDAMRIKALVMKNGYPSGEAREGLRTDNIRGKL